MGLMGLETKVEPQQPEDGGEAGLTEDQSRAGGRVEPTGKEGVEG